MPVGWTNFPIKFKELQSINHPEYFVHASSEWHIVNDLVPDYTHFIYQKQTAITLWMPLKPAIPPSRYVYSPARTS